MKGLFRRASRFFQQGLVFNASNIVSCPVEPHGWASIELPFCGSLQIPSERLRRALACDLRLLRIRRHTAFDQRSSYAEFRCHGHQRDRIFARGFPRRQAFGRSHSGDVRRRAQRYLLGWGR